MAQSGFEIPWLVDPGLIAEAVTQHAEIIGEPQDRCEQLSRWMVGEFATWAAAKHSEPKRPLWLNTALFQAFREDVERAYEPGLTAVGEIFAVTPRVAMREGVTTYERWEEIASSSRFFGAAIARNGTDVQAIVRDYLDGRLQVGDITRLDPAKIKLDDETGITTVTPLDSILSVASEVVERRSNGVVNLSRVCVALQAKPDASKPETMFDATWRAFGVATGRFIYPVARIAPASINPPQSTEELREAMDAIYDYYEEQGL